MFKHLPCDILQPKIYSQPVESCLPNMTLLCEPRDNSELLPRSEPLPYDGLGNGYTVATSSAGGHKRANLNPNRILIKKVGMADDHVGLLAACGSCANGGCCIS